jgi:glycerol-3-phosphate dehydrogenase
VAKASSNQTYDLIVIGAGINGLGIVRDAAERGLKVALVEQQDFCYGVSAWSGRLVHGGLRYLEHGDIPLVRESLKERELLFRVAPHLVKPVRLIMPFYSRNKRPSWMIRLGMIAYDVLSFDKSVKSHRIMNKKDVKQRFTGMAEAGLTGAALFTDGQVEYAERLCTELAVAAAEAGADIYLHSKVTRILTEGGAATGRVVGIEATKSTGETLTLNASLTINAGGPWVDAVLHGTSNSATVESKRLIGGSKGSHIIVEPFEGAPTDVVYYESQTDGRLVLVIPWMGRYLIGTTDRLFAEDPAAARCEMDEIDYLLTEANTLMPEAKLTLDDVIYTYSGVRPLPYAPGVSEWKIPRSHIVLDHADTGYPALFSVVGGKLTTYRQLAEDATDMVVKQLGKGSRKPVSKKDPFPGARTDDWATFERTFRATSGFETDTADRLLALYGTRAARISDMAKVTPALAERFDPKSGAVAAELILAVDDEFAETIADVFARRLLLAFEPGHGLEGLSRASAILAKHLGWSAKERKAQEQGYLEWLDVLRVPAAKKPAAKKPAAKKPAAKKLAAKPAVTKPVSAKK